MGSGRGEGSGGEFGVGEIIFVRVPNWETADEKKVPNWVREVQSAERREKVWKKIDVLSGFEKKASQNFMEAS